VFKRIIEIEPGAPPTTNNTSLQHRQRAQPPFPEALAGDVVVEESQLHHYWEIDDGAEQIPASTEHRLSDDSSDVEVKTAYDHLGHVPRRNTVPPPVYLQLLTDDSSNVIQQDVGLSAVADTGTQAQSTVPESQSVSTDAQPVPDIVQ